MSRHVVLLGDSIFDNAAYTGREPDVVEHLRSILPSGWQASLLAIDGSVISNLSSQLRRVPEDASHLVISVGGNDALGNSDILEMRVRSTAEALELFHERVEEFEESYRSAIHEVLELGRPATLCTIYNGNLPDPEYARNARVALALFNDAILRTAFELRLPVIELRLVCSEPADYANPIEPSGPGGRKIAMAIARAVGALDPGPGGSQVLI
ncbi:MAG TPA: SGNH/GDSL hydrolase family protein [Thermoanaerobaculia bacterium]|nr:SGNH/GDSL hydrolase family protein [Thermoanaerobaculia bacterium]